MTDEELKEIRARVQAATPGPWRTGDDGVMSNRGEWVADVYRPGDEEFIVHAWEDVPALLAEVERLKSFINSPICIVRHDYEAVRDENAKLRAQVEKATEALRAAYNCIGRDGDGAIVDTLWATETRTLWDMLDDTLGTLGEK